MLEFRITQKELVHKIYTQTIYAKTEEAALQKATDEWEWELQDEEFIEILSEEAICNWTD